MMSHESFFSLLVWREYIIFLKFMITFQKIQPQSSFNHVSSYLNNPIWKFPCEKFNKIMKFTSTFNIFTWASVISIKIYTFSFAISSSVTKQTFIYIWKVMNTSEQNIKFSRKLTDAHHATPDFVLTPLKLGFVFM